MGRSVCRLLVLAAAAVLVQGCPFPRSDAHANLAKEPAQYSSFRTAGVLFGEDQVVYLDFGYFTSRDIAAEVNHFLTLCSMVRNSSEKDELRRIIDMVNVNKRARLGMGLRFMTKAELDRYLEWGVLTERELKEIERILYEECAIPPLQFDYFPAH